MNRREKERDEITRAWLEIERKPMQKKNVPIEINEKQKDRWYGKTSAVKMMELLAVK
jgi:hypothetical protein